MRIDNSPNIADNTTGTALTTAKPAEKQDNKNTCAKNSETGNGLTINGYELNLGEDIVEEKRKKAKSMAMQLMLDVYKTDKKLDDTAEEKNAHAKKLYAENEEARRMIADIKKEKDNTNELYGVTEDSGEAKDLDILRRGRDSMGNLQAALSDEEYARYKELYADGLSDYHQRMLSLDNDEKIYNKQISDNMNEIVSDYAFTRNLAIERLKSHDMLDAKKQGEKLEEAASKEIIGQVMQDAVDNIDEETQKEKEDALEKKQEQQKLEERIEKAKGETHEKNNQEELMYAIDDALDEVGKIASGDTDKTPEKSMGLLVAQLQLSAEDVKGLVVDNKL